MIVENDMVLIDRFQDGKCIEHSWEAPYAVTKIVLEKKGLVKQPVFKNMKIEKDGIKYFAIDLDSGLIVAYDTCNDCLTDINRVDFCINETQDKITA